MENRQNDTIPLRQQGFALVVTVSLMVLLAVVAVGLLSLSAVTMRSSSADRARLEARANARLALVQAIGELQKYAGSDQRITASSGVSTTDQPNWTGVWSTKDEATVPVWLVSGNEGKPVSDLDTLMEHPEGYVVPESAPAGADTKVIFRAVGLDPEVRVPFVEIVRGAKNAGRYAWWVSDEGTKARVDLEAPEEEPETNTERFARSASPREAHFGNADSELALLSDPESDVDKTRVITRGQMDLALEDSTIAPKYAHDLTVGGYGLPANVVAGGMKTDLSVLFDSSQEGNSRLLGEYFGAVPAKKVVDGQSTIYAFTGVSDPNVFYLSSEMKEREVGPNWGNLYNYGRLWENVQDSGAAGAFAMDPFVSTDVDSSNWAPYAKSGVGGRATYKKDIQHTNSSLAPVLCFMQMSIRLTARDTDLSEGESVPDVIPPMPGKILQIQMKPILGYWNPYNVKLEGVDITAQWGCYPWARVSANLPRLTDRWGVIPARKIRASVWLRDIWKWGKGVETRFWLKTPPDQDFEPGEIRYYSVEEENAELGRENIMTPGLNTKGAYTFDLVYSLVDDAAGSPGNGYPGEEYIAVTDETPVWFGSVDFDDTIRRDTRAYWTKLTKDVTASNFGTAIGWQQVMHRIADLWTPVFDTQGLKYTVPERVASEWGRTRTMATLTAEYVAKSPYHMGTWRLFSRTATDGVGAESGAGSQRIRAWIDTNPRFGPMNPVWDGSRIKDTEREGFHFISPFIGGSYDGSYDEGPGGRGKIAEGQDEGDLPGDFTGGRARGFGGASVLDGETHVALFDVPRAPLVSLGQFQHAQLARYGYEPAFPFGNSYASIHIPPDETVVQDYAGLGDFQMVDLSNSVNRALWDDYFFSTIGVSYRGSSESGSLDSLYPVDGLASGQIELSNPRNRFVPHGLDTSISKIIEETPDSLGAKAISARIAVEGAFNVNSTSKTAWKAVLSSMADFEFPVVGRGGDTSWEKSSAIRLPRFGHVMQKEGWSPSNGEDESFWNGFREITSEELDLLAENIVQEIRSRGPFRSFADFVNRDPDSSESGHQRKGALQAALDRTVNKDLSTTIGDPAEVPEGEFFAAVMDAGDSTAGAFAGAMLQSDVLQSLAPVLQVRSDYFRIRAVGESTDDNGQVLATATCEAYVQRTAEYVDPRDEAHLAVDQLESDQNKEFGRRFKIVSFRWLKDNEI